MNTTTISLTIDTDTARIFSRAPRKDRSKLSLLWAILLREYKFAPRALTSLMDEIGENASRRGLTPSKLESILNAS